MQDIMSNNEFENSLPKDECAQRSADAVIGVTGVGTPLPPGLVISIITGELYHNLISAASDSTTDRTKSALRTYIDTLEDIYNQM